MKVLDALAMGKPIVAHPVACEGIDVREGHDVVFARDPGEFVHRIVELIRSPERRGQMSVNARNLAERSYSYTSIGRRLICALEKLGA